MGTKRIAVIVGTRPEAIKMAPVIRMMGRSRSLKSLVISTAQHRQMVDQVFKKFGIRAKLNLNVMRVGQDLSGLSSRLAETLGRVFHKNHVDAVLVQGDTTSAFFGGLIAFYHKIPVGHVEAGLRSENIYSPFPEEMNRSLLGRVATWHFAPTSRAVKQLTAENISSKMIHLTGNTIVDALKWMMKSIPKDALKKFGVSLKPHQKLVLVTCHRRESLGAPMKDIAGAIASLAKAHSELFFLFPIHPNPAVRKIMIPILRPLKNVKLCEPLDYQAFLACLTHAWLVLSDSGGVQEEATALGKPVLVLRNVTERMEGVEAGALKLVGTQKNKIIREAKKLLQSRKAYERMTRASRVFGDGHSSRRIVSILEKALK